MVLLRQRAPNSCRGARRGERRALIIRRLAQTPLQPLCAQRTSCLLLRSAGLKSAARTDWKSMLPEGIEELALEHGWRAVSRLGGRQIEFYNDAGARLANEV